MNSKAHVIKAVVIPLCKRLTLKWTKNSNGDHNFPKNPNVCQYYFKSESYIYKLKQSQFNIYSILLVCSSSSSQFINRLEFTKWRMVISR